MRQLVEHMAYRAKDDEPDGRADRHDEQDIDPRFDSCGEHRVVCRRGAPRVGVSKTPLPGLQTDDRDPRDHRHCVEQDGVGRGPNGLCGFERCHRVLAGRHVFSILVALVESSTNLSTRRRPRQNAHGCSSQS